LSFVFAEPHPRLLAPCVQKSEGVEEVDIEEGGNRVLATDTINEPGRSRLDDHIVCVELEVETGTGGGDAPRDGVDEEVEQEGAKHGSLGYSIAQRVPPRVVVGINSADASVGDEGV
jgi:hypothetical protein